VKMSAQCLLMASTYETVVWLEVEEQLEDDELPIER